MRLKQRMNVDFPHPDGPMNAVTVFLNTSSVTFRSARFPVYATARSSTWKTFSRLSSSSFVVATEISAIRELSIEGALAVVRACVSGSDSSLRDVCSSIFCVIRLSPRLSVAVAEEDRERIHRQHDREQHDDRRRGERLELGVGQLDPW